MKHLHKISITIAVFVFAVTVGANPADAAIYAAKNLINNGGFENGIEKWSHQCSNCTSTSRPQDGKQHLRLGGKTDGDGNYREDWARKKIKVPSDAGLVKVQFWYDFWSESNSATENDFGNIEVEILKLKKKLYNHIFEPEDAERAAGDWKKITIKTKKAADKTIWLEFWTYNDWKASSYLDVDRATVKAWSKSALVGTVKNSSGRLIKNARVKVLTPKGKVIFKDWTNSKGKFRANKLSGKKTYRIVITKGDKKRKYKQDMKWGVKQKRKFTF